MEHKCILCGKESLNTIMEIEGFPIAAQHIPSADELGADMGETLRLCQCRRCGFDPWVKKNPWRRKWKPTPVSLPGKYHVQRRLA